MINMAKSQIGSEEKRAIIKVLDSGIVAQEPRVKAFEMSLPECVKSIML